MRSFFSFISFLLCCQSASSFAPNHPTRSVPTKRHSTTSSATSSQTTVTTPSSTPKFFDFNGHTCYSEISQPNNNNNNNNNNKQSWFSSAPQQQKPQVLLIHGFGCSTLYWRETKKYLTNAGYTVHALDLLGQGQSAKPGRADGVEYSIDLWADMVNTYINQEKNNMNGDIVVMGNSLGSNVALTVAATNPQVKGVGMYNCGVGMNSRNLLKDESLNVVQVALFTALFDLLDALIFDNVALLTYLLESVVTRDLLRTALEGLYAYAKEPRVDDALVDSFYRPAKEQGSVEALNQIYTNNAGKSPMELHLENPRLQTLPMHLVWGTQDQVTPFEGPVGKFYKGLASDEATPVTLELLEAGHIPFDEVPECNESMVRWLEETVVAGNNEAPKAPSFLPWL
jgi:pimeloyl-ACP methyl ester carboxylesterase